MPITIGRQKARINIRGADVLKPTFRIGKKAPNLGMPWSLWSPGFRELVMGAMAASQRVAKLEAPGAVKLSCQAFLKQTLSISQAASVKRVNELRRKLDSGDPGLEYARSAVRRMVKELRGPNLRTPPKAANWERSARWLLAPRADLVTSELAAVGHTPLELFGVAILIAGETPGVFGTGDGTQADIDGDVAAAVKERDALFARIGKAWTAADIDPGKYERGHTTAATVKGTHVFVVPEDTLGQRLIQHLESGAQLVAALTNQKQS